MTKLADGFSGIGNAIMDLRLIQNRLFQISESIQDTDEALCRLTAEAFESMIFHRHTWQDFSEELEEMGAIFELFIDLPEELRACKQRTITNPSVQAVINEDGSVTVLSTHEQILNEQVYLGCEFPCLGDYRLQVIEYGQKIGEYLSRRGVKDRFGVDFMCVPRDNAGWNIYAVEINLRLTGTTHPWMTMKLLTHGNMDPSTGSFVTPSGTPKFYVSSDHVSDPAFTKLVPQDLYEIMMARKDLHWDPNKQTGTVFHMLGLLSDCGTVSMTAISNSLEDARKLFEETFSYLVSEARRDSCF